jgi:hypothetical protein
VLCEAIRQAAAAVFLALAPDPGHPDRPDRLLTFGTPQGTDVRPIRHSDGLPGTGHALSARAVANYIAKYATKALDAPGVPDRPLRAVADIEAARCSRHHKHMMSAAWKLGAHHATGNPQARLTRPPS